MCPKQNVSMGRKALGLDSLVVSSTSRGDKVIHGVTEFADLMLSLDLNPYGSRRSLIVTLSEVFSGARECPERLRSSLVECIAVRLRQLLPTEPDEVLDLLARYTHAFSGRGESSSGDESGGVMYVCAKPDIKLLNGCVLHANHIVSLLPGDVFDDAAGRKIIRVACEKLGLIGQAGTEEFRLEVWFASKMEASNWWNRLFELVRTFCPDAADTTVVRRLQNANVEVAVVTPLATVSHLIVTNPTQVTSFQGFQLAISKSQALPSMMVMPPEYTKHWLKNVYENEAVQGTKVLMEAESAFSFLF